MYEYLNTIAILVLAFAIMIQTARINRLRRDLDQTRCATYELTTMAQDDIKDLQDSLVAHGIPLVRTKMNERMRRMSLTPDQRYDESLAKFEEAVHGFEAMWKEPDDPDRRDC